MTDKTRYILFLVASLGLFISACREIYEPDILQVELGLLVAEGFVEVGGGTSQLSLGKTTTIYAEESIIPVADALVLVEGFEDGSWQYDNLGEGKYQLDADLPASQSYRMRIILHDNEVYESEWMKPVLGTAIEKVYYTREEDGVYIYVDATASDNSTYFLLTSSETWAFSAPYTGFFRYDPEVGDVVAREGVQALNTCYMYAESFGITLGSTSYSANGSAKGIEVMRIPLFSEKLGERYSIEVWQRPLDRQAFEFWEALRKNTTDIGGLFSPMPSYLEGNLKKLGSSEPVIGYISAGRSHRTRHFIEFRDIRPWSSRINDYALCTKDDTIPPSQYSSVFGPGNNWPLEEAYKEVPPGSDRWIFVGWISTPRFCVDCSLRGELQKPEFW